MFEIQNVTKTFSGFKALDDLSMTVPAGAVYGLVGPNGAGKSTIIRHLTGVYRPDSGTITMDGQPVYESECIGHKRIVPFTELEAKEITLEITKKAGYARVRDIAVY